MIRTERKVLKSLVVKKQSKTDIQS